MNGQFIFLEDLNILHKYALGSCIVEVANENQVCAFFIFSASRKK